MNKFYITTAIDYVNGAPHIGHVFEKIEADVIARWNRIKGNDVYFLTGTDDNAQKNVLAAEKLGVSTQELVDKNADDFRKMDDLLSISYDQFIKTSDKEVHWPGAQELWRLCDESGDIYKKTYKGLYCVGCETFVTDKDLNDDGLCPEHLKAPEKISEENYFFKLSKYEAQLIDLISNDKIKIVPEKRKNEILSFIKGGLEDFSISRPVKRMKGWGVPVPDDKDQIQYVWMDALSNYITALGFGKEDKDLFDKLWPADVHVIGKGITRFHAIYWPAFLISAGLELPKLIFVHDYITVDGQKMSKTVGNVINPIELAEKYGPEAVRHYFLSEISPFQDGDFTYEKFEDRYNADLAKGLGNLVSRVVKMASEMFDERCKYRADSEFEDLFKKTEEKIDDHMGRYEFHEAVRSIWKLISHCDRYIEQERPWETKDKKVVSNLLASLAQIAFLLAPFLPNTSNEILRRLGAKEDEPWSFEIVEDQKPLFPRI